MVIFDGVSCFRSLEKRKALSFICGFVRMLSMLSMLCQKQAGTCIGCEVLLEFLEFPGVYKKVFRNFLKIPKQNKTKMYGPVWSRMVLYSPAKLQKALQDPICFLMQHMFAFFQLMQFLHTFCYLPGLNQKHFVKEVF